MEVLYFSGIFLSLLGDLLVIISFFVSSSFMLSGEDSSVNGLFPSSTCFFMLSYVEIVFHFPLLAHVQRLWEYHL